MQNGSLYDQKSWLRLVSEGNVAAFRRLFDAYNKRLYAVALKMTKSAYAAEEITQEIFTSLWENRANLASVDNPTAYIFTVAYNKTFRYLKAIAADTRLLTSLESRLSNAHNDTQEWLDVNETRSLIDAVVKTLSPQRQQIFKLSREEGLSHKEIADQLHISPLTVKKQMVIALRNIRSGLARIAPLLAIFFF